MNTPSGHSSASAYDAFLCHNSQDKLEVLQVAEALKLHGLKPWIDEDGIKPGEAWRERICAALDDSLTAAVFIGTELGENQKREIELCQELETHKKIQNIIPVILPSCVDDAVIPGFLRGLSRVDFRRPHPNPLIQLCNGIGNSETSTRAVVAVEPMLSRHHRHRLISFCLQSGQMVPRAGLYPPDLDSMGEAFIADLEDCHVVVRLDADVCTEAAEAKRRIDEILDEYPFRDRVIHWNPRGRTGPELRRHVVERAQRAFDATRLDPEMESGCDQEPIPGHASNGKSAMVKYDRVDAQPTREMLRKLREARIHCVSYPNGSTTLADRMREHPFDALIVVLGQCDDDWLERRIDELSEVSLTWKEQSPLLAYYYVENASVVAPVTFDAMCEFDGPNELDRLVQAILAGAR